MPYNAIYRFLACRTFFTDYLFIKWEWVKSSKIIIQKRIFSGNQYTKKEKRLNDRITEENSASTNNQNQPKTSSIKKRKIPRSD